MKTQTAQGKTMTPGQLKDFISALVQEVPMNLPYNSKGRIIKEVRKLFASVFITNPYSDIILEWEQFYSKHFNQEHDFSNVRIPDCPGIDWRLLIITNLLLEQLYAKMKDLFPTWRWTNDDLDKIVTINERDAKNGTYAIWVRNTVEPDEKYSNHSADKIKTLNIKTETLVERAIHGLKYFDETGKHLDIKGVTLCSGSRYSVGNVPRMRLHDHKVDVYWISPGHSHVYLCSREVVS